MQRRAFTIIELLIVIAIMAILATLSVLYVRQARTKAKLSRVSTELSQISSALTQYAEDNNYQYPPDTSRAVPPGLERYLTGGTWPEGPWPTGVFDWENWLHPTTNEQIYQISYRLCDIGDPESACADPILFPNFVRNSSIFYCISGPCIPHRDSPSVPAYCVNCNPKPQNY